MLRSRILTALGLTLLLVIAILYSPPTVTAAILSLILLIGAWEWSGFLAVRPAWRVLYVVLLIGGGVAGFFWTLDARSFVWTMAVAVVWWLLALLWIVGAPQRGGRYSAALAGLLALLPTWIALVHIDAIWPQGAQWTLFILALSFARHRRILRRATIRPVAARAARVTEEDLGRRAGRNAHGSGRGGLRRSLVRPPAATLRATVSRSGSVFGGR